MRAIIPHSAAEWKRFPPSRLHRGLVAQKGRRVDGDAVAQELEVQVLAGREAALAHVAKAVAGRDAVAGAHRDAIPFVPTGLLINGVDTGNAAGPGWYWNEDHTVFLTNAGPFAVSGTATNGVGVLAKADCAVVFTNDLAIDCSSHPGHDTFRVSPGRTVTFTLAGRATLSGGAGTSTGTFTCTGFSGTAGDVAVSL